MIHGLRARGFPPLRARGPSRRTERPREVPLRFAPLAGVLVLAVVTFFSPIATAGVDATTKPEEATSSLGQYLAELDPVGLAARQQETERELAALERKSDVRGEVSRIVSDLGKAAKEIVRDAERAEEEISGAGRWTAVADICFQFVGVEARLARMTEPLARLQRDLSRVDSRAEAIRAEWSDAASLLEKRAIAEEVRREATHIEARAAALLSHVRAFEKKVTRAQADLGNLRSNVNSVLRSAEESTPGVLSDYSLHGATPWETVRAIGNVTHFGELITRSLWHHERALEGFIRTYPLRLAVHLLLWFGLTIIFLRLSNLSLKSGERPSLIGRLFATKAQSEPLPPHIVYRHPFAAGALTAGLSSAFLYPVLPAAGTFLAVALSVIAAAVILIAEQERGFFELGLLSLGLLTILAAHIVLDEVPAMSHLLLAPEAVLVAVVAFRTAYRPALILPGAWGKFKDGLARTWLLLLVLGVVGWFLGYEVVATAFISGTSRVILLTIAFQAGYSVIGALLGALFHASFAQRSLAIRKHSALLLTRSRAAVRWILLLIWINAGLTSYSLKRDLFDAFAQALDARWEVGTLSLSLGDLGVFGLGITVSVLAAKLLKFLLDEELLPRSNLRVGTAAALGSGTYFIVVTTGLFMAFAAAGLRLERIAIVVSALGVGIGFGLQNIVQNFVAGLILLFGRPINVSDVVQVRELLGRVTKVGARASTIRTFAGAEVIVPNSTFVSEQVINWSLSDENRRVELDVGVAYGSDPKFVIELLENAAKKHPEVLAEPPVEALLTGFGDSALSFQLRAWIAKGDRWTNIKSDLGIVVYAKLREAKIEIPFPQRDIHLRRAPPRDGADPEGERTPTNAT